MLRSAVKKLCLAAVPLIITGNAFGGATYTELARWPEGKIPIFINTSNAEYRALTEQAIQRWEQAVPSLKFVRLATLPTAGSSFTFSDNGKTYTSRRWMDVSFVTGPGCGTNTPPMQGSTTPSGAVSISLGVGSTLLAKSCFERIGDRRVEQAKKIYPDVSLDEAAIRSYAILQTVVHEMGHGIGLVHEHERFDAANHVNVDYCKSGFNVTRYGQECTSGDAGQFTPATTNTALSAYDYFSLMHYNVDVEPVWVLSVHQSKLAEVMAQYPDFKRTAYEAPMFSASDIQAVNQMYGNYADHRLTQFAVTEPSAGVVQVTATVANVGPYASTDSRLVINIPSALAGLTPTLSGNSSSCGLSGPALTCNFGTLDVYSTRTVTLRYSSFTGAYGAFTATASFLVAEPTAFQQDNVRRSVATQSTALRRIATVTDSGSVNGAQVTRLNGADHLAYVNSSTAGVLHAYIGSRDDDGLVVLSHNTNLANNAITRVQEIGNAAITNNLTAQLDDVRKVLVSKNGNFVYVFPRRQSAFNVFSRNPATGALTLVQVVTQGQPDAYGMVVDGLEFNAGSTLVASRGFMDAALSADGNWLYVVNDRRDSLAVFDVSNGERVGFNSIYRNGVNETYFMQDPVSVQENPTTGAVYVSGAGDNSVQVFVRENGALIYKGHRGNTDWSMNPVLPALADVNGRSVLVTRGNSTTNVNNFSLWTLDPTDLMPVSQRKINHMGADQTSRVMNAIEGANNAVISADGSLMFSASYGQDAITVYRFNTARNNLTLVDQIKHNKRESSGTSVPGLDGASGIALSPDGRFLAVTGRISDAVSFYAVNPL